jgi:protein AFG1
VRGVGNLHAQHGEFAAFSEVLEAHCETWEMEGSKDYRRIDIQGDERTQADNTRNQASFLSDLEGLFMDSFGTPATTDSNGWLDVPENTQQSHKLPKYYFVESSSPPSLEQYNSMPWTFSSIRVYGRTVLVPRQNVGTTSWTFSELCGSTLGPVDYITLRYSHLN